MLYIELNSKAAEGHIIMTIYDGELVSTPLPLRMEGVSRAYVLYHPVKVK